MVSRIRTYILASILVVFAQWANAGTALVSADENWIGGAKASLTTEGNDFWLSFLNNNMINPEDPANKNNPDLKFEMKVAISAREAMDVVIAAGDMPIQTVSVGAGETQMVEIPRDYAATIYLFESQEQKYKGVHVYAADGSKDKVFSCFLYSRVGGTGISSRDASLVLPSHLLGKEYIVQTYPEDLKSTEFAIIATEDNTNVTIVPKFDTYGGKNTAGSTISVTLAKGDAYLVASKEHEGEDFAVDLSGSTICADKPVAVFNGNQQTGIPNREAYSQDFMVEQAIPIEQWGTEFYLTHMANTKSNYTIITAAYDDTEVTILTYNASDNSSAPVLLTLQRGQTSIPLGIDDEYYTERYIHSNKPITCYSYITSAAVNNICTLDPITGMDCYTYGDPANAMMPAWNHRVKSMNLFSEPLDPQGGDRTPQHFFAYIVTRWDDRSGFVLNGAPVDASYFKQFNTQNGMAYAHIPLPSAKEHPYNLIESSGEGFVGMVYALTDAQGYFYTLGFQPPHPGDSLYITNSKEVTMSRASYDMDSLDGHGWYQRQEKEWIETRLDTAVVCDSSWVYWAVETPQERPIESINWQIFDVTDGGRTLLESDDQPLLGSPAPGEKHTFHHQFILPEEEMGARRQYYEYEVQAVLARNRILCTEDFDRDTLKTTVRVTRIYNDTLYRVVCVGDTLNFFYDSLYNPIDNTQYSSTEWNSTKFIGVKKGQGDQYLKPWHYQVEVGKYDTLSRHYLSQAGCDSTMTLILSVCDTFQYFDTIHLCHNKELPYHGRTIRGADYKLTDTVDIRVPFHTSTCECQLGPAADKFRDKEGNPFHGCDSTYYLHLFVHENHLIKKSDTVCLSPNDEKGSYEWSVQYGTDTKIITQDDLEWSEKDQALKGVFRDSMLTKGCPECEGGGCDSVHELTILMPKSYYFQESADWCMLHYDESKQDTVHRYFRWEKHRDGAEYVELRESGTYYDSVSTVRYGCDSVYEINLTYKAAGKEFYHLTTDTVCFDSTATFIWKDEKDRELGTFPLNVSIPKNQRCTTIYSHIESGCDTVYAMHLTILPKYYLVDTVLITQEGTFTWPVDGNTYGGNKATAPHNITVDQDTLFVTITKQTKPLGTHSCDSTHVLFLRVGAVYRDVINDFACGDDEQYVWEETRPEYLIDGEPFIRQVITDLPAPGQTRRYKDEYLTVLGFDSVFYLDLYRAPSYKDTTHAVECQQRANIEPYVWIGHEGRKLYDQNGQLLPFTSIPLTSAGDFYYLDTMHTETYECDSLCVLHLHINPYHDLSITQRICQGEPFIWEATPGNPEPDSIMDRNGRRIYSVPTNHIGDYNYTLHFHSAYGCDSAIYLNLHIDTVYSTPVEITERVLCDNDTLHFFDRIVYGAKWPEKPEGIAGISVPENMRSITFDSIYTARTIHGCDSAVLHRFTMYQTYLKEEEDHVCQGTEYIWHGRTIPTDVEGGLYTYYDSLKTEDCPVCDPVTGRCGCDSVHVLKLRVDSVYHIHNNIVLCDNDSVSWQGRHYKGIKFSGNAPGYRVLKSDTTYMDTVEIGTRLTGCDSTYYLALRVAPTYDTTVVITVCDYEDLHIFEFSDTHGAYYRDSIPYAPHPELREIYAETTHYETVTKTVDHMLKSVEGCDSAVHLKLIIKPSYTFVNSGKGCYGDPVEWRGRYITTTGTYYDRLTTKDGCDSIFIMEFYITPFITIPIKDTLCDNQTYWHRDTIYREDGTPSYFTVGVWSPGMTRPDEYTDVHFKGADGCDSIVYRYYLTFCPTYSFDEEATVCSGEAFYSEDLKHEWTDWVIDFNTDTFVLPYDTLFIDSLLTYHGCDSVYNLKAHVLPSYRHIEYDTICSNESYTWHSLKYGDSIVSGLDPGVQYLRDSFLTINDCDSIFEMQLYVKAAYFHEDSLPLCADETLQWRSHFFEHMAPGEHFFYDSLTTESGCDSIFHLYLTVIDTTYEIRYDSICIGDTLFIGDHMYTAPGKYKDTVSNDAGCHHFIYTHLAVIEPTIPTVWAENPMCASETAFDVLYTYTNHYPIAYTLLFDSVAHSMGFEDIIDEPITKYTHPMVISVPIPYGEDRTQYPRPDNYSIQLILDNGICRHKETDCYADSSFVMSYPKWITEQRFGDVIAILNDTYNGGYTWSHYQWYLGDSMLVGQTQPYLYIPTGLHVGEEYHVQLIREGETEEFPSCPIMITQDPIEDNFAPTMGYLSVTPTCVAAGHPVVNILSRKDGTYRVTTSAGRFVKEGVFHADVTPVEIPATEGLYIIQLWSFDTPEEPYRAIKVMVSQQCESCATSF